MTPSRPLCATLLALACSGCEPSPEPEACAALGQYALEEQAPVFDRSQSAAALSAIGPASGHHVRMGYYQTSWEGAISLRKVPLPNGPDGQARACFAQLSFDAIMRSSIHVASEVLPRGCADGEITRHEMEHHRIQLAHQRQGADRFVASRALPVFSGAPHEIDRQMSAFAKSYASDLARAASDASLPWQNAHDSPEEYARVSASCSGELAPIARMALSRR